MDWIEIGKAKGYLKTRLETIDTKSLSVKYIGNEKYYKFGEEHVRFLPNLFYWDGKSCNAETDTYVLNV